MAAGSIEVIGPPIRTGHPDRDTTFRLERWRAVCLGIFDTAGQTFLLLIAVKVFALGSIGKAWLAVNQAPGFLLAPLVLAWVTARGWRCGVAAGRLAQAGALFLVATAFIGSETWFVIGSLAALLCATCSVPLFTQIYQENYPAFERGRLYASTNFIRVLAVMGFSALGGWLLSLDLGWYRALLVGLGLAFFLAGTLAVRLPSRPYGAHAEVGRAPRPSGGWRYVREDRIFRLALISWMFMGLGNLMMIPLRIEYLAAPAYGIQLPPDQIAFFTGVIPSLARLIVNPLWGRLFDRFGFLWLRMGLNLCFALGIFAFFSGATPLGLWAGAVIFGISISGGDVMWSLWVTKIAPPDRVASYMSVHTFLTGTRGLLAPFLGFGLLTILPMQVVMIVALVLIVISVFILFPGAARSQLSSDH